VNCSGGDRFDVLEVPGVADAVNLHRGRPGGRRVIPELPQVVQPPAPDRPIALQRQGVAVAGGHRDYPGQRARSPGAQNRLGGLGAGVAVTGVRRAPANSELAAGVQAPVAGILVARTRQRVGDDGAIPDVVEGVAVPIDRARRPVLVPDVGQAERVVVTVARRGSVGIGDRLDRAKAVQSPTIESPEYAEEAATSLMVPPFAFGAEMVAASPPVANKAVTTVSPIKIIPIPTGAERIRLMRRRDQNFITILLGAGG
jgi:hypothetical protein